VRAEVYERLEAQSFAADVYPHVMEIFGREGWNDPSLDIYDELDPRKSRTSTAARSCS
jgi:hypothetical protein